MGVFAAGNHPEKQSKRGNHEYYIGKHDNLSRWKILVDEHVLVLPR